MRARDGKLLNISFIHYFYFYTLHIETYHWRSIFSRVYRLLPIYHYFHVIDMSLPIKSI